MIEMVGSPSMKEGPIVTEHGAIKPIGTVFSVCVCVCVCGHFQQTGHQPGIIMVDANPACGQLNRENGIFPVPVRA